MLNRPVRKIEIAFIEIVKKPSSDSTRFYSYLQDIYFNIKKLLTTRISQGMTEFWIEEESKLIFLVSVNWSVYVWLFKKKSTKVRSAEIES